MKLNSFIAFAALLGASALSNGCTQDSPVTNPPVDKTPVEIERGTFAKGADVSWLTQLEAEGHTFSDANGNTTECMQLLKEQCGVNAIRLRVWVNPEQGWCDVHDVLVKARRAQSLGLRLMIDFHFSDTWADPGQQKTPAAWANMNLAELQGAVAAHVTDVLTRLKNQGIEPEWVQIGNEVTPGFMHPLGSTDNPAQFTQLVNSGYDATKAIFPDCQVIVHIDGGDNWWKYNHVFGILAANNGKYDMIGLSIYPEADSWKSTIDAMMTNVAKAKTSYGKPVMLCEIGMEYDQVDAATQMMAYLMKQTGLEGIFYWEPESPGGYNGGYNKGCFNNGTPTTVLDCFK